MRCIRILMHRIVFGLLSHERKCGRDGIYALL